MYYDKHKEFMEMKALLENDLNIRFDMDHNKIFTLATLLDPRYKQQFFEAEDLISFRSQCLLKYLKNSMSNDDSDSGKDDSQSTFTDENNIETATHRNFWHATKILHREKYKMTSQAQLMNCSSTVRYDVIKRNDDPFQWWSRNNSRYPEISRMAKVYFCFPASSVYSERLFSEAGSIYETKRNREIDCYQKRQKL